MGLENSIRPMQHLDVLAVVDIHIQAFQGFFLSFLGPRFLQELYSAIIADPSGIAFTFHEDDNLLGFVVGTDQPSGFYRRLLRRRWWRFALASFMPLLKNPTIIPRLFRAFSMPQQGDAGKECGTLMSIAVLPEAQGNGVGKELVGAFLQEASRRKLKQVNLTTDKLNNDAVNLFYQRLGFKCIRSLVTPEGREMNEYLMSL